MVTKDNKSIPCLKYDRATIYFTRFLIFAAFAIAAPVGGAAYFESIGPKVVEFQKPLPLQKVEVKTYPIAGTKYVDARFTLSRKEMARPLPPKIAVTFRFGDDLQKSYKHGEVSLLEDGKKTETQPFRPANHSDDDAKMAILIREIEHDKAYTLVFRLEGREGKDPSSLKEIIEEGVDVLVYVVDRE